MVQALKSYKWRETLEKYTPWWLKMADVALHHLEGGAPAATVERERKEMGISLWSTDPFGNSLKLIDELLAIDSSPPFDTLQERLVKVVTGRWNDWPVFTKATVLHCLRGWFWYRFTELRSLISDVLREESHPLLVNEAVRVGLILARKTPVPELSQFLKRASSGGYQDSLRSTSRLLGAGAVKSLFDPSCERANDLCEIFLGGLRQGWTSTEDLCEFLSGAMWGAAEFVGHVKPGTDDLAESWLIVSVTALERWPFDRDEDGRSPLYPIQPLEMVLKKEWRTEVQCRLFHQVQKLLESVLSQGSLAEYCHLHFMLKEMLTSGEMDVRQLEVPLLALCRASVDRVVVWRAEGKSTNDAGWAAGLYGRESVEIIKSVLEVSRDRDRLRRELVPLADKLGDAGLKEVAADLRAYLRRS